MSINVFIFSPEEDEDGFPIRNSVHLVVVLQVRHKTVNQTRMHLVHLVKDEHGASTLGDVTFDPLLQLRLRRNGNIFNSYSRSNRA